MKLTMKDRLYETKYWWFTRRADKFGWWFAKNCLSNMMKIRVLALSQGEACKLLDIYPGQADYADMHSVLVKEHWRRG